jgi:hypothetical protein
MAKKVCFFLLLIVIFMSLASASDVAYIFRNDKKIDQNFIDLFEEMDFDVYLIDEKNLPEDLSDYDFVFVGNERFRKDIPVNDYPSVISNYYYGDAWGLTDRDEISQLGATSPLNIVMNGAEIIVYTKAFRIRRIGVPYYFLDKMDKADSMVQIASTKVTSSGENFGDVISHAEAGSLMGNGKVAGGNICFFGIISSDFWTEEARELLKDCVRFVSGAQEEPGNETEEEIECHSDSDCPADFDSAPYCAPGTEYYDDNVYQRFTNYTCMNPGMASSQCVYEETELLIDDCDFGCYGGGCLDPEGEENIHDVGFVDFSGAIDLIKLTTQDDIVLLENDNLVCNEKYKIIIKIENKGNSIENVSFDGSVDGVEFSHLSVKDFMPEDIKEKTRTVNFSLSQSGDYDIEIDAFIEGFSDDNPVDNKAIRRVSVSCHSEQ